MMFDPPFGLTTCRSSLVSQVGPQSWLCGNFDLLKAEVSETRFSGASSRNQLLLKFGLKFTLNVA
jgi:hypothetical protein